MEIKRFKEIPDTVFEYYPGNKVLVKTHALGVNTLIQVFKPGTYKQYSGYSKNPVALISMNGTGIVEGKTFDELQKKLEVAIQLLNKEGDGKITLNKLSVNMQSEIAEKAEWQAGQVPKKPTKYIRQADLVVGHVYEELNGRKTLYLGNSHLYLADPNSSENIGSLSHHNRTNDGWSYSNLVYGDKRCIETLQSGYTGTSCKINDIDIYSVVLLNPDANSISLDIDTYVSPRKFVKDLGVVLNVPSNCKVIIFNKPLSHVGYGNFDCIIVNRSEKTPYMHMNFTRKRIYWEDTGNGLKFEHNGIPCKTIEEALRI